MWGHVWHKASLYKGVSLRGLAIMAISWNGPFPSYACPFANNFVVGTLNLNPSPAGTPGGLACSQGCPELTPCWEELI